MKNLKLTKTSKAGGRPTKYKPEFNRIAFQLCLLGATDVQLAEALEVSINTIDEWKKKYPGFRGQLRRGKIEADGRVAQALYKRALGFSYDEVTFEKIDVKAALLISRAVDISEEAYKKKVVTKYVAPDTGAAMNWLKNRQKELWRDKQTIEFEYMSDDDLDKLYTKVVSNLERKS